MNTRAIAAEYRLAQWAQAMRERAANRQGIDEFCQARGVSRNTYFYWQRKLREAAAGQLASAGQAEPQTALVAQGWVEASAAAPESAPKAGLTLRVGGAEIQVHQGFDAELLALVCKALMAV
jgi:putative transposase